MSNFAPDDTDCTKCVFYKDRQCGAGLWKTYEDAGISIHNSYIQHFICPYFRPPEWLSVENLFNIIEKENIMSYFIVLNRPKWKNISDTINKINKYKIKPELVYFYVDSKFSALTEKLCEVLNKRAAFKWKICAEYKDNTWFNTISDCNGHSFLLYCNNLPDLEYDWMEKLSYMVNKELKDFSYAEKDGALLIPPYVYNSYYFEYTKNFIEKMKEDLCHKKYQL